jgi:hypothetical protein
MDTHKNARLTSKGREQMIRAVVGGMSKATAARQFNTTPKTFAKWVNPSAKKVCMVARSVIKTSFIGQPNFPGQMRCRRGFAPTATL